MELNGDVLFWIDCQCLVQGKCWDWSALMESENPRPSRFSRENRNPIWESLKWVLVQLQPVADKLTVKIYWKSERIVAYGVFPELLIECELQIEFHNGNFNKKTNRVDKNIF